MLTMIQKAKSKEFKVVCIVSYIIIILTLVSLLTISLLLTLILEPLAVANVAKFSETTKCQRATTLNCVRTQ